LRPRVGIRAPALPACSEQTEECRKARKARDQLSQRTAIHARAKPASGVTGETRSLHEGGKAVPRLLPQATDFLRQPLILVAALIAGGVNQWAQEPSAPSRRSCCAKMEASMSADSPRPPFQEQQQPMPGSSSAMDPRPDHGESSYKGSGRLADKKTIITGGDSGIGRAVALAFAREGADVLVSYYNEDEDAKETQRLVEAAGRQCLRMPGDIKDSAHCREIVSKAVAAFGRIDVLVNNAAHQASFSSIDEISDDEWDVTFRTNIHSMFYLTKATVVHMPVGGSIINTASINADTPSPQLLAYATTKGAIQNFTAGLAQLLAEKGIRVNCVAPGPIWTPLIPSTMPPEKVKDFGKQVPMKRPGQPRELAPVYVMLAADEASYISGATVAVTGGKPII